MSDGLIYDDREEKSWPVDSSTIKPRNEISSQQQQQYGNLWNPQSQVVTPNYPSPYGIPNSSLHNGYLPPAPAYSTVNYPISPMTPQLQPGQNNGYAIGYPGSQPQYAQVYQPGYNNNSQPQISYNPNYPQFQPQQQPQYGQPSQTTYAPPPLQQSMYPPQPLYGASDEKQLVVAQAPAPAPTANSQQILPYQQPPPYLAPEIINVPFKPVTLHGDDQHHAVKSMLKAGGAALVVGAILGTYLQKKREKERHRLSHSWNQGSQTHSSEQVAMYNHLMDKLESLSGNVLTEHRHSMNEGQWQEAMHPHRRAVFADLYNNNENVRGFCSEFQGGPTTFPQMDEYSLGMGKPNLNFQRANRQAPNWNVARELLSQVRTVILLDDSGSMQCAGHSAWDFQNQDDDWGEGRYQRRTKTRWDQGHDLIAGIAPLVSRHNRHGIDVHFLNHHRPFLGLHSSQDVHHAFQSVRPGGGTPTGRRVGEILDGYMCVLRYNRSILPLNLIVVTDGEAQDEERLHRTIEHHVTQIVHRGFRAHQFGIEFLQVGDDEDATRHLERLEEEVSRHHHEFQRDVVGVTPTNRQSQITPDKLLGIVLSGVDARLNGYMRHTGVNV